MIHFYLQSPYNKEGILCGYPLTALLCVCNKTKINYRWMTIACVCVLSEVCICNRYEPGTRSPT